MEILAINALTDNYIWIIKEAEGAIVVDPGEAQPVLNFLEQHQLQLTATLITHHHVDHTGGLKELLTHYPDAPVYGPSEVEGRTYTVADGQKFTINHHQFFVKKTAGHTEEHISFLMNEQSLFCGDALFSAGCGRVFTKDYQAQYDALKYFESLADEVKVYAGHEYTLTNLKFANSMEPDNLVLQSAIQMVEQLRADNAPTLPSTIGLEKDINLFMTAPTLNAFVELRKARDEF